MSALEVPLGSILGAFQGAVPSPIATVSADGIPNSTYLSVIWYVDEERVAISNQFLGKTTSNLRTNPQVAIIVVDPTTMIEYALDATHLRTERSGAEFEAVRARLEAVAAQSGMEDVFRLRSIEVLRVDRCRTVHGVEPSEIGQRQPSDVLAQLEVYVRRLSECRDLAEATRVALESIDDLFGFRHSMLLVADAAADHVFTVASNGYAAGAAGVEIPIDEGVIGVVASRRRQVRIENLDRMALASAGRPVETVHDVAGPGLEHPQSLLATPLLLHDRLIGVLYLDSEQPARFDTEAGHLVEILAGHLAVTIALLEAGGLEPLSAPAHAPLTDNDPRASASAGVTVVFHEHDGTVLLDGDYIIKGVPGRILFALLSEHDRSGRVEFTNREIRLDAAIGLPVGNDNLEARLLALRRRLADRTDPFRLARIGRGRLRLTVDGDINLVRRMP